MKKYIQPKVWDCHGSDMPTSPRAIYALKSADGKDIMHQCTDLLYKLMVKLAVKTSKIYKNSYSLLSEFVIAKRPIKRPIVKI